jgi:TetR/AcrR family transcriptional regulator, cholesterol catabolism regulator
MPRGIPLTEEEQQRRRKEIFDASLQVILEKGFTNTSMHEIARAADVGKSTLYDYYRSKDEILIFYFNNEIEKLTARAQEIIQQDHRVTEKLKNMMLMHMRYLVDNKHTFLKLSVEVQRLSLESQEQIQTKRHAYQDMIRELIEEGTHTGEFRAVNSLLATRSISNLLATAVFTSRPTGTPEEMLDDVLDIFFTGIQA